MSMGEWVLFAVVAFAIFSAGRAYESREGDRHVQDQEQEDLILGTLGPIAAKFVSGRMTRTQADAEVRRSERFVKGIEAHWNAMTSDERAQLGRDMLTLYDDPAFHERMAPHINKLSKVVSGLDGDDFPEDVREEAKQALGVLKDTPGPDETPDR